MKWVQPVTEENSLQILAGYFDMKTALKRYSFKF